MDYYTNPILSLRSFLQKRKVEDTLQKKNIVQMGKYNFKYYIPPNDMDDFYKLYEEVLIYKDKGNDVSLCLGEIISGRKEDIHSFEGNSHHIPIVIDIDFHFPNEGQLKKRYYPKKLPARIYKTFANIIQQKLQDPNLDCLLLNKPAYVRSGRNKASVISNGFHLHFYKIFQVRELIEKFIFSEAKNRCIEIIKKSFEENITVPIKAEIELPSTWLIYGSSKSEGMEPYLVNKVLFFKSKKVYSTKNFSERMFPNSLPNRKETKSQKEIRNEFYKKYIPSNLSTFPNGRLSTLFKEEIYIPETYIQKINRQLLEKKTRKNYVEPDEISNPTETLKEVRKLLDIFSLKRSELYLDWLVTGNGIFSISGGSEEGRQLFHSFSSKCPDKYNPEKIDKQWNKYTFDYNFTLNYFRKKAEEDDNEKYNKYVKESNSWDKLPREEKDRLFREFQVKNLERISSVIIDGNKLGGNTSNIFKIKDISNVKYVGDISLLINECENDGIKHIAIRSPMNSGKTYSIVEYIKTLGEDIKILVISPRVSFAYERSRYYNNKLGIDDKLGVGRKCESDLKFYVYLEFNGEKYNYDELRDKKRIFCSIESINRVKGIIYDVVILDEINSILRNVVSVETNKDKMYINTETFRNALKNCKTIISADALFNDMSKSYFMDIGIPTKMYRYDIPSIKREVITYRNSRYGTDILQNACFNKLLESVSMGEKNYVFFTGKELLKTFEKKVNDEYPTKKMLVYHSDNPLGNVDVNDEWKDADLILSTSSISVGISFDVENVFHNIFIFATAKSRNYIEDVIQGHYRIRHLINNKIHLYIDKRRNGMNYPTYKKYIERDFLNKEKVVLDKNIILDEKNMETFSKAPYYLRNLFINVQLNKNISIMNLYEGLLYFFDKLGYDISHDETVITQKDLEYTHEEICRTKYGDIINISDDEYNSLLKRQRMGIRLPKEDVEKIRKHQFQEYIDFNIIKNVDDNVKSLLLESLFEYFNGYNIGIFGNIALEKSIDLSPYLKDSSSFEKNKEFIEGSEFSLILMKDLYNNKFAGIGKCRAIRFSYMVKLYSLLGISNSNYQGVIPREKFDRALNFIGNNLTEIKVIFDMKNNSLNKKPGENDEPNNLKQRIEIIQTMFNKWGFSVIKKGNTRRAKNKGIRINVSEYIIYRKTVFPVIHEDILDKTISFNIYDLIKSRNIINNNFSCKKLLTLTKKNNS